jgi:uncharacterized protein YndB with AHSA1/START domain
MTPRSLERQVTIAAPPAAVWRALTDAEELTRWFPLEARVEPGGGGAIFVRWDDADQGESRITIWEPERHLGTVGWAGDLREIVTDYYLEAAEGGTRLRVVNSGFGRGTDWDEMLDGFGYGWDFELRGLRHYLERHRGAPRHVAWVRLPLDGTRERTWHRLAGPGGWFGDAFARVAEGDHFSATTPQGDRFTGQVERWQPPHQLVARVEEWNDALLRVHLTPSSCGGGAIVWLSTYGMPSSEVGALAERWRNATSVV